MVFTVTPSTTLETTNGFRCGSMPESLIDDATNLKSGELSMFIRLGTDVRSNYYEYEIPLVLTPHRKYSDSNADRRIVWPEDNFMDINLKPS